MIYQLIGLLDSWRTIHSRIAVTGAALTRRDLDWKKSRKVYNSLR